MELSNIGYYWLDSWILANIIQLATQDFCRRYLTRTNDPCGRQYDQMTHIRANCLLILCNRLIMMLRKQIANQLEQFKLNGGFTEALTAERLVYRTELSTQSDAPTCLFLYK